MRFLASNHMLITGKSTHIVEWQNDYLDFYNWIPVSGNSSYAFKKNSKFYFFAGAEILSIDTLQNNLRLLPNQAELVYGQFFERYYIAYNSTSDRTSVLCDQMLVNSL